jgi:arylformamidase
VYATVNWNDRELTIDYSAGRSLAIPLIPDGPQPAFFSSSAAYSEPIVEGAFIGDVRQGGSCNAEIVHWAPHCHGTHTECIGHILADRVNVLETIDTQPVLARLVTCHDDHGVISADRLQQALENGCNDHEALIIRSLPNSAAKLNRDYQAEPDFPVLDSEAVLWLTTQSLRHLLIDTPSLDSPRDSSLPNHRSWWGVNRAQPSDGFPAPRRSITELIYVPDQIVDGEYWLHLELSPLVADATPSRPMIYPVIS